MSEDGSGSAVHSIPVSHPPVSHPNGRRLSHILSTIASDPARPRIAIGDLLDTFGQRGYGALIFLFATPNLLPVAPPGMSSMLAAPLLFLTWQLAAGRPHPWLPALIRERSFERTRFQAVVARLVPTLQVVERMVRPRLPRLTEALAERLIGALGLLLAVFIFLPIPLGNVLPALSLVLLALGILERDGAAIVAGLVSAAISTALVAGVGYGVARAASFVVQSTPVA